MHRGTLQWIDWHPRADFILAGTASGSVYLWDVPIGTMSFFSGHSVGRPPHTHTHTRTHAHIYKRGHSVGPHTHIYIYIYPRTHPRKRTGMAIFHFARHSSPAIHSFCSSCTGTRSVWALGSRWFVRHPYRVALLDPVCCFVMPRRVALLRPVFRFVMPCMLRCYALCVVLFPPVCCVVWPRMLLCPVCCVVRPYMSFYPRPCMSMSCHVVLGLVC